ncbi:hypothetical protein BMF94_3165 [Rhodotorula taiwanensis]|uniref:Prephenate dehydratase domain-containing protein n=1 Tax=Rhodotorula taiwanensis TaxID=741276 RepID=A0A2S5BA78_9BASI|nr:hypothetical protein BMF94_3165 [Rhodotorula taiwanensis]
MSSAPPTASGLAVNGTKRPRVAFLGPLGTYSHQAMYGVVPIENSSFGPVAETTEQLRTSELALKGMTALRIGHALLASREADRDRPPKRVYSHEQALGQCRRYLQDRYSEAEIVQVNSTAKAAQEAGRDPEAFAISPIKCADVYGLQVIDRDIQDAGASECRLPPQGYQSPPILLASWYSPSQPLDYL